MEDFKLKLEEVSKRFNLDSYNEFNLFSVLHHITDERRLHSRFIAFLLNPEGSHKEGSKYLELFLKNIGINDFTITGSKVYPTESDKKEHEDIDIFVYNDKKQAIIIENKIFAGDSNKVEENGSITPQLLNYYNKKKEKFNDIKLIYLTLNAKEPSLINLFTPSLKPLLASYIENILVWLDECLKESSSSDMIFSIKQYRQLLFQIVNDYKLALALKEIAAESLDSAYKFWIKLKELGIEKESLMREQFKHIQWHTIHEFFSCLKQKIEEQFSVSVSDFDIDCVTAISHRNSSRSKLVLSFEYKNDFFYVCNDSKGFTIGNSESKKWEFVSKDEKLAFCNFENEKVFNLINNDYAANIIDSIVDKLDQFIIKYNHV